MINIINNGIKTFFAVLFGVILVLLIFFSNVGYICKKEFLVSNIVMMLCILIGIAAVSVIFCLIRKYYSGVKISYPLVVMILAILLFSFQIYLTYNIYFRVGWDVNTVFKAARQIAHGYNEELNSSYFSKYSNNLFLVSFYALVLKINSMAGIFTGRAEVFPLLIINCAFSTLSCVLIFGTLRRLIDEKSAFFGFLLGIGSFGLSPWAAVPYSDSVGLIFPILILYIYIRPACGRVKSVCRYFLITMLSVIGYMIKPQIAVMLIAIILMEFVYAFKDKSKKLIIKKGIILVMGIAVSLTVFKCADFIYEKEGFVLNKELSIGMTHFLKMGLNESTNGVYSREDVDVSTGIVTRKERNRVNFDICKDRLEAFGVKGYLGHLWKKILVNYNDGTFAWGVEGGHFKKIYKAPDNKAAPLLRSIYYMDGKNHIKWGTYAQAVWLLILLLCFCAGLGRVNDDNQKIYSVIFLAIIGLTAFELLFEARARYLYTYVPVYCILAGIGAKKIINACKIFYRR